MPKSVAQGVLIQLNPWYPLLLLSLRASWAQAPILEHGSGARKFDLGPHTSCLLQTWTDSHPNSNRSPGNTTGAEAPDCCCTASPPETKGDFQ